MSPIKYIPVSYTHLVMYVYKGKATRIGFAEKDGKKVRVAKSTGDIID